MWLGGGRRRLARRVAGEAVAIFIYVWMCLCVVCVSIYILYISMLYRDRDRDRNRFIDIIDLLLAQLSSSHRGGPVPALLVFRRVEWRSLSGSSPYFSVASPLLSARCARAGRSAPCARRAARCASGSSSCCTAHWDRLSAPRWLAARTTAPAFYNII